ncbi:MAG: alpha-glucosidase/alpha-galactosidase, partial [Candidatus Bipolaricaulota bacterium]
LEDAEELCPDALVLNYTNQMHMMTMAANEVSDMEVVGLCHSVQGTSRQLAGYLEVPYEELEWECAGINHMSWFTKLEHEGRDLYPELLRRAEQPEIYEQDPIRFEMTKEFGYFVTESSGHFSEYLPYFRKDPELIDKYCGEGYRGESGFYSRNWPDWRRDLDEFREKWIAGEEIPDGITEGTPGLEDFDPAERSYEYGSHIIEAQETGQEAVIYGNFPNEGLIDNLPGDGIVEVKTLVDRSGFHPCKFGRLPEELAGLNRSNMTVHKLTVESILNKDREAGIRAFMLDPLTAAVSTPSSVRNMVEELFEAESEYIPDYLTE